MDREHGKLAFRHPETGEMMSFYQFLRSKVHWG